MTRQMQPRSANKVGDIAQNNGTKGLNEIYKHDP